MQQGQSVTAALGEPRGDHSRFARVISLVKWAVAGLFIAVVFFPLSMESRYECAGNVTAKNDTFSETLFLKVIEYQWWVKWWRNSAGNAALETTALRAFDVYPSIRIDGDVISFDVVAKGNRGYFSTLSNRLNINLTDTMIFDGSCKKTK